jgi:hypothetical protein
LLMDRFSQREWVTYGSRLLLIVAIYIYQLQFILL